MITPSKLAPLCMKKTTPRHFIPRCSQQPIFFPSFLIVIDAMSLSPKGIPHPSKSFDADSCWLWFFTTTLKLPIFYNLSSQLPETFSKFYQTSSKYQRTQALTHTNEKVYKIFKRYLISQKDLCNKKDKNKSNK